MKDIRLGEKTCAVFSLKEGFKSEDMKSYAAIIKSLFEENKIPVDEIKVVKEIPMDTRHHSKVEYSKLKEMLIQNA